MTWEEEGRFPNRPYGNDGWERYAAVGMTCGEEGRAVPEPPLRVVRKVGFDGIAAVNFRGDDMIGGGLRRGFGIWRLGG